MRRPNPYSGLVDGLSAGEPELLHDAVAERRLREEAGFGTLAEAAELYRISHQTAWEWRHRLFAAVDGCQGRIVLRGRVWIDETYVNDTDLSHGYGQARKRGLSRQKICIAVGIDARKEPVAVVCGHGKPSSARVRKAMKAHVAEGSTLVHDRERAHNRWSGRTRSRTSRTRPTSATRPTWRLWRS